jgi:murein L,D-transpeptidase YcbB/YkuD
MGQPQPQLNPALQSLVDGSRFQTMVTGPQMTPSERTRLIDQTRRFYQAEHYQLVWVDGDRPSKRARQLEAILGGAGDNGLPGELYKLPFDGIEGKSATIPADRAPELDVRATVSYFRYFLHLSAGRLDPHALESQWTLKPDKPDLVGILTNAVDSNDLRQAVNELSPQQPQYADLQKALVKYRAIAAKGGWPAIAAGTRLKPGDQSPMVRTLRDRLAAEGDFTGARENEQSEQAVLYDASITDAVQRFRERHRIKSGGMLDPETITAMNVPVDERIKEIDLALERWRWLPDHMPDRYLLVNVPDYRLDALEHGTSVLSMRVVVGAPDKKTPIFADKMEYVIFSPYWNVPPDIARNETLPHAAKDPDYLARNNMEAVDASGQIVDPSSIDWTKDMGGVRIRQRPGSGNALGGVKFVFPNNFNVYLHDTNAGTLFERMERSLSHGCVRVEEPAKLAQYVLRDQPDWTPEKIQAAMQSGQEHRVNLEAPLPVYILYMTAWVHEGGVRFLKDIYGHDEEQKAKLWADSN